MVSRWTVRYFGLLETTFTNTPFSVLLTCVNLSSFRHTRLLRPVHYTSPFGTLRERSELRNGGLRLTFLKVLTRYDSMPAIMDSILKFARNRISFASTVSVRKMKPKKGFIILRHRSVTYLVLYILCQLLFRSCPLC